MTNTIDMIKKCFSTRSIEILRVCIITCAGFLLGHLILLAVMAFDNSQDLTSFEMGTVCAAFFCLFAKSFFDSNWFSFHFNYAVSMGKCRKHVATAFMVLAFVKGLVVASLIYVFHIYESFICRTVYKEFPVDFDFDSIFTAQTYIILIIVLAAFEICFGSIQTKFGPKALGFMWLFCMLLILIPSFIEKAAEKAGGIKGQIGQFLIDLFNAINENVLLAIGLFLIILMLSLPFILLRKQRVTL